jgi:predicted nucleic acid-binding protein
MFLLDTNVLSELRRLDRTNTAVARWARGIDASDMFLSVVTIFEIERGARLIQRRDPAQGTMFREWIDHTVLPVFQERILAMTTLVAIRCAALHVPNPRPERDGMIAATALVHGMTVATRNTGDFTPMGVAVVNPWLDGA